MANWKKFSTTRKIRVVRDEGKRKVNREDKNYMSDFEKMMKQVEK
jgi:hypothetical protein